MPITEKFINVLIDVEEALENVAVPNPDQTDAVQESVAGNTPMQTPTATQIELWTNDPADLSAASANISTLIGNLYDVPFLETAGKAVGNALGTVVEILQLLADKLAIAGAAADVAPELAKILEALRKIPGADDELDTATEILEQIVDLLDDIPSAQAELYMIAQQIKAIAGLFIAP